MVMMTWTRTNRIEVGDHVSIVDARGRRAEGELKGLEFEDGRWCVRLRTGIATDAVFVLGEVTKVEYGEEVI